MWMDLQQVDTKLDSSAVLPWNSLSLRYPLDCPVTLQA